MFMRSKSSDERVSIIKRNSETLKNSRYEEFLLKYSQKQKATLEKQNKYKNELKERSNSAQRRHLEAAARRKLLIEEKQNKILARKSKSSDRECRSNSNGELKASSVPGVFLSHSIKGDSNIGTAGFGRGFNRSQELYFNSKSGVIFVNTSAYDKRNSEQKFDISFNRSCRSLNQLEANTSSERSEIKTSESIDLQSISLLTDSKSEQISTQDGIKHVSSRSQSWKSINNNRVFRSIRRKRVSFIAPKYEKQYEKPAIKKSLIIETPETKKGILLKMSTLSSVQRNNGHPKYEPGMVLRVTLPSDSCNEEDCEEREEDIQLKLNVEESQAQISEATNTEPSINLYSINSITTSFRNQGASEPVNCGLLLQTCKIEKMNRKLKLAQLHEDLIKIESETKKLNDKNSELTKNFINKFLIGKDNVEENLLPEDSSGDSRRKIITNSLKYAIAAIRPKIDNQIDNYIRDKKAKQYKLIYDSNNSCKRNIFKTTDNDGRDVRR